MPWYQRDAGGFTEVRILEVRGTTLWKLAARDRNRGRASLVSGHETAARAHEALAEAATNLQDDGFKLTADDLGIDDWPPKKPSSGRLGLEDVGRALKRQVGDRDNLTLEELVDLFAAVFDRPRAFNVRGYWFEVHAATGSDAVTVSLRAQVRSADYFWREIGYRAALRNPEGREWINEVVEDQGVRVGRFLAALKDEPVWRAVADWTCTVVGIDDHEID